MLLDIAARVTRGHAMPLDERIREPQNVMILGAEDGAGDTIRPRLLLAGADLERVYILDRVEVNETARMLKLPIDTALLEEHIAELGVRLVIIDSLMSLLGGRTDTHRDSDVRDALVPLTQTAERTKAAIVAVRHHTKMGGLSAADRGIGSAAFSNLARSQLTVAPLPSDPDIRIVAGSKNNLVHSVQSLGFRLESHGAHCKIQWLGPYDVRPDELVQDELPRAASRTRAQEWLLEELSKGALESTALERRAKAAGISWRTLRRAGDEIGVLRRPDGFRGKWVWSMPEGDAQGPSTESPQSAQQCSDTGDLALPYETGQEDNSVGRQGLHD
jgi:hypothetical protein